MHHIIKIICILLIELNIYYFLGYGMNRLKIFPKSDTFGGKCIYGFLGYHVLFWCLAFPCTLRNISLTVLAVLWTILLCFIMIAIICLCRFRELLKTYQELFLTVIKYRLYVVPCLTLFAFLIYYVCVNGQSDIDAQYYIGEVTTKLDTDRLVGVYLLTGEEINALGWKHAFSMFGTNSAVLCKVFQMRPLVFCRTVRATINIVFLAITSFELFLWAYRGKEHKNEKAIMAVMLSGALLFAFANTIYTPSAFILHRAYEGKAYCSGMLVLILIYLVIGLCEKNEKRFFGLIFMSMLAGMSISASATFLMPMLAFCMVLAYVLHSRRWRYIPALFAAVLPNIVYFVIYTVGFAGFQIK